MNKIYALVIPAIVAFAFAFSYGVAAAQADNGNGQNKDCLNQTQVQTIVAEQIQNVTEVTQNQTIQTVEAIINDTVTDTDEAQNIIEQIETATIANSTTNTIPSANHESFIMTTDGLKEGTYRLYQNGEDTNQTLNVIKTGGVEAGTYNVTKID